jgi:hypothetical protein
MPPAAHTHEISKGYEMHIRSAKKTLSFSFEVFRHQSEAILWWLMTQRCKLKNSSLCSDLNFVHVPLAWLQYNTSSTSSS